jgi:hypothetical protein
MDDLDLLKELPGRVDPPDEASRARLRELMQGRIAPTAVRRPRRTVKVGLLGIAAVLSAVSLAAGIAVHPWTSDDPVALQGIPDPNGQISSPADLESVVAEFAPAIRLPDGGSFDVWIRRQESLPNAESMFGSGLDRVIVVREMVRVAQCQWGQRWLEASSGGDRAGAAQAVRVVGGIDTWFRSDAPLDDFGTTDLLDPMKRDDRVGVQSAENTCGYTGSWGSTSADQDLTAKERLTPAVEAVQRYLENGGDPAAFGPAAAGNLAPDITWTTSHEQPAPASPGYVFIGPSAAAGVTLVSVSESGTQFCAVVTDTEVQHGTTSDDLATLENADGTVRSHDPGPVICIPGGW